MSNSRREFIAGALGIGAGAMLASCKTANNIIGPVPAIADDAIGYPWPYTTLDPKAAAQRGYDIYWERHCMAGPFEAVVAELGRIHGEPFSTFPFQALAVGSGGIKVGTVCGCCNGSALALGMFVADSGDLSAMVGDLFNWYEQTELPVFVPSNPHEDIEIVRTAAHNNTCHASVTRWSNASGYTPFETAKKERCARLTADVTEKLVEMLNAYFAGTYAAASPMTEATQSCRECHDKGGMVENSKAKMDCLSCHDDHTA